jgi:hypothetical protein
VSTAETMTRGAGRAVRPPRRVVLLSESMGLAALLKYLLGASGTLTRFATLREADDREGLVDADTVVLDLPREGADTTLAQVRHRYRGELIVFADRGHGRPKSAPEPAWTLLERPFSAVDLGTALGLPGLDAATAPGPKAEPKPDPDPAAKADRHPPVEIRTARPIPPTLAGTAATTAADVKAAARKSPSWAPFAATAGTAQAGLAGRASRLLAALTHGWQAKRRVRVAGFSVFALVAFVVAFALAAQGGRCGPGCDALGTVFSPDPTVAPASSSAPSTTGPKRSTTTAGAGAGAGTVGTGSFQGIPGGRVATPTTTTTRRVTATTRKPSPGGAPTTRPATTRPPTTPTTQPPTTPTTQPPTTPTTEPTTTAPTTTGGA